MVYKSIVSAICVCLAVVSINAHSSIVDLQERDYLIAGDGLITYDQSTGLSG